MPVVVSTIVKEVSAVVKGITTYNVMEDLMGKTIQDKAQKRGSYLALDTRYYVAP